MEPRKIPARRTLFLRSAGLLAAFAAAPMLARTAAAQAAKMTKAVAKYQDTPHNGQACDQCMHFVPGKTASARGSCKVVEGDIAPKGWCIAFAKKA